MNKLNLSTTMTLDGVIDVAEWYVAGGEHDRASRERLEQSAAMLLGRKTYEGSRPTGWPRRVLGPI
jgi:hypothetical protein